MKKELITLSNLAKMLEKPVMKVYKMAQEAAAIRVKPKDDNIYIDVDVFQSYLDNVINEEIKNINYKTV